MTDKLIRELLVNGLTNPNAHITFDDVVADLPVSKAGLQVPGFKHTAWQLLEHLRIAQFDILEFCRDPEHESPSFPEGYWPESHEPPSQESWEESIELFQSDLGEFIDLVNDKSLDLLTPFEQGEKYTLLREALVLIKHNSYHVGQLALLKAALIQ